MSGRPASKQRRCLRCKRTIRPAKTLIAILAGLPRGALIDATFAGPGFTHDRHLGETVRRADAYGLLSARVCRLADELRGVCGQCHEKKEER